MNFTYETKHLILKVLDESYTETVLSFLKDNRQYFEPFEVKKSTKYYSYEYQSENLNLEYRAFLDMKYLRYYVFLKENPAEIIGTVSFSNIMPYPYSCLTIGYKFSKKYQHMGYATETLSTIICALFKESRFHRIEAYVLPNNKPSIRLLTRIGFDCEGICRKYICINGKYQDHFRYSLINFR